MGYIDQRPTHFERRLCHHHPVWGMLRPLIFTLAFTLKCIRGADRRMC